MLADCLAWSIACEVNQRVLNHQLADNLKNDASQPGTDSNEQREKRPLSGRCPVNGGDKFLKRFHVFGRIGKACIVMLPTPSVEGAFLHDSCSDSETPFSSAVYACQSFISKSGAGTRSSMLLSAGARSTLSPSFSNSTMKLSGSSM